MRSAARPFSADCAQARGAHDGSIGTEAGNCGRHVTKRVAGRRVEEDEVGIGVLVSKRAPEAVLDGSLRVHRRRRSRVECEPSADTSITLRVHAVYSTSFESRLQTPDIGLAL